jgi:hypothetical protein
VNHAKFKGSYQGRQRKLNINPDAVSIVFNRDKRVILRLRDGLEVALDDDYDDADSVAEEIWGTPGKVPAATTKPGPEDE